jgi:hypothetical protein
VNVSGFVLCLASKSYEILHRTKFSSRFSNVQNMALVFSFCVGYTGKNGHRPTAVISTIEITFVEGVWFVVTLSVFVPWEFGLSVRKPKICVYVTFWLTRHVCRADPIVT